MMMMSKDEAEAIALDVHATRPDWDTAGIMAALAKCRDKGTPEQIRAVALTAARDARNHTPGVIALAGAHWDAAKAREPKRAKCPDHELELPCRSCRADNLAAGLEQTTRPRARTYTHEPAGTPMPDWLRNQLAQRRRDLA